MKLIFWALFTFSLVGTVQSQTTVYTIADLESLEIQKNFREFVRHAHDIRPSQRDRHWREMVISVGTQYLDDLVARKEWNKESFNEVEMLASWTVLREDLFFIAKRDRFAQNYLTQCLALKESKSCLAQLKLYWNNLPGQIETASQLVQLFSDFAPAQELSQLILMVSKHPQAKFYCGRETFAANLLNLMLNSLQIDFNEVQALKVVKESASQECWDQWTPWAKTQLFKAPAILADRYYRLLQSRNVLNLEEQDLYLTYYFLMAPKPGDGLNRSWNRVQELAEQFERRQSVVKALLKLDPLPGKLFALRPVEKLKPLFKHFQKSIPEYLDHYVENCLNYMDGSKTYPNGNPTVECQDLFQSSDKLNWPEPPIRQKFSAIKK